MPAPRLIAFDEAPDRRVAVAVELWDPIAQRAVTRGVEVKLKGRDDKPILSRGGRFVWIGRQDEWPPSLSVDPGSEPFARIEAFNPPTPARWPNVQPAERLIRVRLTPTVAYPLQGEVTCVRGDLFRWKSGDRLPIVHATVELQWWDLAKPDWRSGGATARGSTVDRGNFVLFARIAHSLVVKPDVERGYLKVRLLVTNGGVTRSTPATLQFLPPPAPPGRIAEGGAREHWVSLDWDALG